MAIEFDIKESAVISGIYILTPSISKDIRGNIWTSFLKDEIEKLLPGGLYFKHDKFSTSKYNVLRGIHGDYNTAKLISCPEGKFYFVVVNNIIKHPQYRQWVSFTLSEYNRWQVLIPAGFGNGHLVMSERAIFCYKQTSYYDPKGQFTLLWNDPNLDIWWPCVTPILSVRDQFGTSL